MPTDAPPSDGQTEPDGQTQTDGGGGNANAPTIMVLTPTPGQLVSGVVELSARVEDPDGIGDVSATIGSTTITMTQVGTTPVYRGSMNTVPFAGLVSPTVIVRASDMTGEMAQVGFQVILDNEPPIASLDSPRVRVLKKENDDTFCSADFDPLGGDAPDDGDAVAQLIEFRARVRDVPNTGTTSSTVFIPRAGTKSVQLFVFDDTTKPLVVDTNADGTCDAINPTIVPKTTPMTANEAASVQLTAIEPKGAASFTPDNLGGSNESACSPGTEMEPAEPLCFAESDTTVVITTPFTTATEIYGIPPAEGGNCLGFAFDARAYNISEGWACAAVLVTDNLGNTSVSAPLRICVDANGNLSDGCTAWGTTSPGRPNCTGTVSSGTVTNTPCTARDFFRSTTPDEFELLGP